jgi:hypothetical protein
MPSGHSMVATEFLVWIALETLFPPKRPSAEATMSKGELVTPDLMQKPKTTNFFFRFFRNIFQFFTNTKNRFLVLFWAIVLLLPVPISRVVLNYHTTEQVRPFASSLFF